MIECQCRPNLNLNSVLINISKIIMFLTGFEKICNKLACNKSYEKHKNIDIQNPNSKNKTHTPHRTIRDE